MKVAAKLPLEISVDDYHEFQDFEYVYNLLLKEKVKVIEVGFDYDSQDYIGIVYIGKMPKRMFRTISKRLKAVEKRYKEEE